MNLANTFARIRVLFPRRKTKTIRMIDVNDHIKRDIGLYDFNSDRRVHERTPRAEEFIVYNAVTRAP